MKNLLTYIKSIDFAFIICILAMLGQAFHTFYAFYAVSSIESDIFRIPEALILVLVFECFTLFYLMRGKPSIAKFYSFCLFVMNIYYYYSSGTEGIKLWLGIFLSIIIPVSIYYVAEEVKQEYEKQPERKEERLDDVEKLLKELERKVDSKNVKQGKIEL